MKRREFCLHLAALPGVVSAAALPAPRSTPAPPIPTVLPARPTPGRLSRTQPLRFVLQERLEHPFYEWPRTLLRYPIEMEPAVDPAHLVLTRSDTGESIPYQLSEIVRNTNGIQSTSLNFATDLPSGARREFVLAVGDSPTSVRPQVKVTEVGNTLVLDSGVIRVRIPNSQEIAGEAPGPILQVSRGGAWFGTSTLAFTNERVTRLTTRRVADGPLFVAFELDYETQSGAHYIARIQCEGGFEFVRLQENLDGLRPGMRGTFTSNWTDLHLTHRQAPNHPFPLSDQIRPYDEYPWERLDEVWNFRPEILPEGRLPFALGTYERAPGNFRTGTFANFWNQRSGDALGLFIDDVDGWHDHEYAYEVASTTLQVRYHLQNGAFLWKWPLARGRRSTCVAFYDHALDQSAMRQLEAKVGKVERDGLSYAVPLTYTSHTLYLQNRYGTLDLNRVKDWVLDYPEDARRPAVLFPAAAIADPAELERRVLTSPFTCTLPVTGTRQMAGHGPIPGRNIVNFSPVPTRQFGNWIESFNRCRETMTDRQRRRLTAMFLFMAHVHAADEFMPIINLLSGHPNFLADVKAVPPGMSFLFPTHPQAANWADMWEKCVELNTRFNTRPAVNTWAALGGRWTENLGTYVWAFLRPSLRTEFLLRQYDGRERFLSPQLAELADWLVNALSAPFDGESVAGFKNLNEVDQGREWGVVPPGKGPRRVHPPQGAHAEQRIPPRSLWYLGACLQRYAPLAAEHALWAARPTDPDAEDRPNGREARDIRFQGADNRGTNPHLRTRKFTGYGIVLRAAVDTPNEISLHLQQIDEGSNYRWGRAAEGGCGILYFHAAGKSYSYTGPEDVGDRDDQDTDFATNFGIYKNGVFRTIGMNVLSRPCYDLGTGQFAEIVPRPGPNGYSTPEYLGRSILLAGADYFVLYDSVSHQALVHRLTWFVRKGDDFPTIKLLLGAFGSRETQRTEISTATSTGRWFDGLGDSLAVVSHRPEIQAEGTPFGCRVHLPGIEDWVFRNPQPIQFAADGSRFEGTAGWIRKTKEQTEFALFHGTHIGVPGIALTTTDTELGISGIVREDGPIAGEYLAPTAAVVRIRAARLTEKTILYVDGSARPVHREVDEWSVSLEAGRHHWELTDGLPVPRPPRIVRTENRAGGARILIEPVAAATGYQLEWSPDNGTTWNALATLRESVQMLNGRNDGEKVHVRARAHNSAHASAPGPEYPVYVTAQPPAPPEGLRVGLAEGAATVTWGEILGVTQYRLYARTPGEKEFRRIYQGLDRAYIHRHPGIQACAAIPGRINAQAAPIFVEYYVTAVNDNGESGRSFPANTDPAAWRNWDPKPGERFRRVTSFAADTPPESSEWPRYYPE